jgi:cytochrome c oxidase subunit II
MSERLLQSAMDPAGPQAAYIWSLSLLFFVVCTLVFLAVTVAVILAVARPRREIVLRPADGEPGKRRTVAWAMAGTIVILTVFLGYSVFVGHVTSAAPNPLREPLTVEVIGYQWWWEFRYVEDDGRTAFATANEMHIPIGRPVIIRAISRDVIHSFWVPNLHGKIDLVPGHVNTIWIEADRAGRFRGQCAEFCGLQHAKMAFVVVADEPDQYEAWATRMRQPALDPTDPVAVRGRDVFLREQCVLCHTIRGTGAWGRIAPDLTHLGLRHTIAAGALPNTRGHLAGWILDPQHVKPGTFMPATHVPADDMHALLTYLEGLR